MDRKMDAFGAMRLFVAIAESGSISGAARENGLAVSTVSWRLRRLEEDLGVQLVVRTTRRLALTEEGRRFLTEARRILSDVEEVMGGIAVKGAPAGRIRATTTHDLGRERIAPLADAFMRAHPGVHVELYLTDAVVDLVEGGFDLALRTGPLGDSELKARLLLRGVQHVCAAPDYWRRRGRPARPEDLARHNCLLHRGPGDRISTWSFAEEGRRFRVQVGGDRAVNDGGALRRWAIAGAGVVRKLSFDIEADLREGRLETALEGFTTTPHNLYAVAPPRQYESRRVRAFVDFLAAGLRGEAG